MQQSLNQQKRRARPAWRGRIGLVSLLSLLTVTAQAQDRGTRPDLLPEACERDLALSAAPEHLREGATVYVLRSPRGFVPEHPVAPRQAER